MLRAASNFPTAYVMNSFADLCFTTYLPYSLDLGKSSCNVDCHCTGPEEESDQCVMSDIAEELAEQSANDVLIIEEVGEVVNTEGHITNEGVH